MIRWKLIKETATRLLDEANVSSPPVVLGVILEKQGASLTSAPTDEHVSGFLLRHPGEAPVIGFNSALPVVRQRFIVAHELGHLLLHGKTGLHVDRSLVRLEGEKANVPDEDEIEANRFAAELLMPEEWIREDARLIGRMAVDDDPLIGHLAQKYRVSKQAMTIRLTSIGLIQM